MTKTTDILNEDAIVALKKKMAEMAERYGLIEDGKIIDDSEFDSIDEVVNDYLEYYCYDEDSISDYLNQ